MSFTPAELALLAISDAIQGSKHGHGKHGRPRKLTGTPIEIARRERRRCRRHGIPVEDAPPGRPRKWTDEERRKRNAAQTLARYHRNKHKATPCQPAH
jgi:hypothetical protein